MFGCVSSYSQSHLNIKYGDNSYQYAQFADIVEVTFNAEGDQITIEMTDGSMPTINLGDIAEMYFGDTGQGTLLPVEIVSFTARVNKNLVTLMWTTATEVDNYGFEVQRSNPPLTLPHRGDFETVGFVEGAGNSNSLNEYLFTDDVNYNLDEHTLNYRLKQINTDGSFEYSETVTVELGPPDKYELKQNYPNPFNPATVITYGIPQEGLVTLKVYDILGREISVLVNENKEAGIYSSEFNGSYLSSGIYFCRLKSGSYKALIKMLLIK